MLKQQFSGVKKAMAILLTVFFVVSLTAGAVSACGASAKTTCSSCNDHVNECSSCTASGHACGSCAAAGHTCKSCGSKSCHSKHHSYKSKSSCCSACGCTA